MRPQPWTHIRLSNPALKLPVTSGQIKFFHQRGYHETVVDADSEEEAENSDEEEETGTEEYLDVKLSRHMRILWRYFYVHRQGTKPKVNRILPLEKLLWIIQEVYEIRYRLEEIFTEAVDLEIRGKGNENKRFFSKFLITETKDGDLVLERLDDIPETNSTPDGKKNTRPADHERLLVTPLLGILDLEFLRDMKGLRFSLKFIEYFFDFLEYRYHFHDLAMNVAHDFITSLQIYETENKVEPLRMACITHVV